MRTTRKRLTVSNRHDSKKNKDAMTKVLNRYSEKMQANGWIPYGYITAGNAFFKYETYVGHALPKNEKEKKYLIASALESGWRKINRVFVY